MVKYEELNQAQWTAGLATMAAQERDTVVQRNMFVFVPSILQDICDYGFAAGRGALALILTMMEASRLSWLDLAPVQAVREKYSYRSIVASSSQSDHSTSFHSQGNKPKIARGGQHRICRNFNSLAPVPKLLPIKRGRLFMSTFAVTVLQRALGFLTLS